MDLSSSANQALRALSPFAGGFPRRRYAADNAKIAIPKLVGIMACVFGQEQILFFAMSLRLAHHDVQHLVLLPHFPFWAIRRARTLALRRQIDAFCESLRVLTIVKNGPVINVR